MGAVIKYKQYHKLIGQFKEALHELLNQLNGECYDRDKIDIIYSNESIVQRFLTEFEEVVINNLETPASLRTYIQKVYYDGIGYLLVKFKLLQAKRLYQLNEDWMEASGDNMFTIITNGYIASLDLLANKVYSDSRKYSILDLKYPSELKKEDYNITGEYKPLLNVESENGDSRGRVGIRDKSPNLTFEHFLIVDDIKKQILLQYLLRKYTDAKPKELFFMLCALVDLGLIKNNFTINKTSLYNALRQSFGEIGTRQAHDYWFSKLNDGTKAGEEENINAVKWAIQAELAEST